MGKKILLAVLFVVAIMQFWGSAEIRHGHGIIAPHEPRQLHLARPETIEFDGYQIKKLARFDVKARVLGRERYWLGQSAALAPVDLALGWGPMSDEHVLDEIEISQSGRFYHWWSDRLPIPASSISLHSANMHLIPASEQIRKTLTGRIRKGNVVQLSGYLVSVTGPDGWRWNSSLTRKDRGDGACEVILVEQLEVL